MLKIQYDVDATELQAGDAVLQSDGRTMLLFVEYRRDDSAPGSYGEVSWKESHHDFFTTTTTARPWDTWAVVVREA